MENEKLYELREIKSEDLFLMLNIINKIGMKEFKECFKSEEVKNLITNQGENVDVSAVGMQIMLEIACVVVAHASDAKEDIYKFLSDLSGLSVQEIKEFSLIIFTQMIVDVFKKEEFADFFGEVLKLFK